MVFGANVCAIGAITTGDNATVSAGCVVVKDVPEGDVVVGNPGRLLRIKKKKWIYKKV